MNTAQVATEKRRVVVGTFGPRGISIDIADDFGSSDEWRELMDAVIDNAPEAMDFTTPDELGRLDAMDNIYNPPRHSTEAHDSYIIAWNNQWAKANGRTLLR